MRGALTSGLAGHGRGADRDRHFPPPAAENAGIPEHVELRLGGFTIGLGTVEAARRVHGVEAAPRSPAMVLVVWTDNVDEAYRDLAAARVPTVQPPHDTGNNNRNAMLRDPDGNLVEIVAKKS